MLVELERNMLHIGLWMHKMRLRLNPSKTEFVYFGTPTNLMKYTGNNIMIGSSPIEREDILKLLHLDNTLPMKKFVNSQCYKVMTSLKRNK